MKRVARSVACPAARCRAPALGGAPRSCRRREHPFRGRSGRVPPHHTGPARSILSRTLVVLALLFALATPAAAHLYLVSSQPAEGAELQSVPREIRLTFSEPAQLAFTQVEMVGPGWRTFRLADPAAAPGERNVVVLDVEEPLQAGSYTVAWRTVSADGHPVSGQVAFEIAEGAEGLPVATTPEPAPEPQVHHAPDIFPATGDFTAESPAYVVIRWLLFVGLLGVIGTVAFRVLILRALSRSGIEGGSTLVDRASARAATVGAGFGLLLLLTVLARLYAQAVALYGTTAIGATELANLLRGTTWGTGWLLQVGATLLVLGALVVARRGADAASSTGAAARESEASALRQPVLSGSEHRRGESLDRVPAVSRTPGGIAEEGRAHRAPPERLIGAAWIVAAAGAAVLAFTPALGGHAIATPDLAVVAVLSDGLHVLGAAGWLGGLLALLLVGLPIAARAGAEHRAGLVAALVSAFSPTALFFAGLVTLTGVLSASFHVGSFALLWESGYGRTLLLKIALLAFLFATGAYNWLRVRPTLPSDLGTRRLRRSSTVELGVGIVVLLVTAVLVATPPPADVREPDPIVEPVGQAVQDQFGRGTAILERRGDRWIVRHTHTSSRPRRDTDPRD